MKNRKSKVLKAMGFSSLALVMGAIGTLAFAPLNLAQISSASEAEMATEQGLITPKADDPVIYTTKSGLDIKWGNAIGDALGGGNEEAFSNLTSGNLKNLPYFTTKSGSTTYTWVIIGQNLSSYNDFSYQNLTYWQTNKSQSTTYTYFFNNIYETTTPAGSAIKNNNLLNDYAARKIVGISLLSSVTKNTTEIPVGCVLVVSNDCVATGAYNITHGTYYGTGSGVSGYRYSSTYYGDETIAVIMENYYKNKNFGLNKVYSNIQTINISTYSYYLNENNTANVLKTFSTTVHLFPFGMNSSSSFYWANYLTTNQVKCSTSQWVRGRVDTTDAYTGTGPYYLQNSTLNASGNYENAYVNSTTVGYRPAFCLKI